MSDRLQVKVWFAAMVSIHLGRFERSARFIGFYRKRLKVYRKSMPEF